MSALSRQAKKNLRAESERLFSPRVFSRAGSVEVQASPQGTLFLNRTVHTISVRHIPQSRCVFFSLSCEKLARRELACPKGIDGRGGSQARGARARAR